jgi:pyruvate-formate lyase
MKAMNERTRRLRQASLEAEPSLSSERAELLTDFYQAELGRHSVPVLRALAFRHLCQHKTLHLGPEELIVGERGPAPKVVPTYPELTCHSLDDLEILDSRPKTRYRVPAECREAYRARVIPYWRGRSMRDRIFAALPRDWHAAYEAGIFTEFMEQRAPGHTVLDDKIYAKGMLDFKLDIADTLAGLDLLGDPEGQDKQEALRAMDIACDAVILFAERHADLAEEMAAAEEDRGRRAELQSVATCRPTPRGISTKRSSTTGFAISRSSPSSTAGMPSTPAIWTSTFYPFTSAAWRTEHSLVRAPVSCSKPSSSSSTITRLRPRSE